MQPIVLINAVGLTPRLLELAPRLKAVAAEGWVADMPEVLAAKVVVDEINLGFPYPPELEGEMAGEGESEGQSE